MAESFCKKAVNSLVGRHITEGRWSRTRRQEKGSDSLHITYNESKPREEE